MATKRPRTGSRGESAGAGPSLTAQVIVRAASGKRLRGSAPITGRTLAEHVPSPDDASAVQTAFRSAGFEVGALGGISFSISAPRARYEQLFGVELEVGPQGAVSLAGRKAPKGGLELPLERLPSALRGRLEAVTFEPPADLHGDEGSALF